jgi:Ca2+-binding RTX toxin-like protein
MAFDFAGLEAALSDKLATDDVNAVWDAIDLESAAGEFLWSNEWSALEYLAAASEGFTLSAEAQEALSQSNITLTNHLDDAVVEGTTGEDVIVGGTVNDTINGLEANDRLYGNAGDDVLNGGGGKDTLLGGEGADELDGGLGIDTLIGGAGDDVLGGAADSLDATRATWNGTQYLGNEYTGGTGDDTLRGTRGADVYHYNLGDGSDLLIDENGNTSSRYADRVEMDDVNHDQLWFERSGDDLVMSVIGTDDQIRFQNWYLSTKNQIEEIQSSDGMALTNSSLDQLVSAMATLSAPASGELTLPTDLQEELAPVLSTAWQAA